MRKINNDSEVVELYQKNIKVAEIAKICDINIGTIYNVLKRNGITIKRKKYITDIEIIEDYKLFNNMEKLAKKYKISPNTIKDILVKNGIDTSIQFRRYGFTQDYFKQIDSNDKAYFLGLLYSDGYVNKEGFELSLSEIDGGILEIFKKYICYQGKISTKISKNIKHKTQKRLNIYSKEISIDLHNLGCHQNKSLNVKYPYFLEERYISHFIRGVFDGDGCLHIRKGVLIFSIIGNFDLISPILTKITTMCGVDTKSLYRNKRCNGNIVNFCFQKKAELVKIYKFLYTDCEDLYMERKKIKFENFLYEKGLL